MISTPVSDERIIYAFEAIRTRGWAGIPALDIMNLCHIVEATFEGGRLFERQSSGMAGKRSLDRTWLGEKADMELRYFKDAEARRIVPMPKYDNELYSGSSASNLDVASGGYVGPGGIKEGGQRTRICEVVPKRADSESSSLVNSRDLGQ